MPTKDEVKDFSLLIEKIVDEERLGYMDAICQYCKESGLEIEVAATLISSNLKSKIKLEAQDNNMLKKTARLPI
jgi:hypothetical protein